MLWYLIGIFLVLEDIEDGDTFNLNNMDATKYGFIT